MAPVKRHCGKSPGENHWREHGSSDIRIYVVLTLGYSIEYGGRDGFIDDLYLVPAARGWGFGRDLLEFALARAAELGIGTLHLEVETENEAATRLYRAAGFEETGRRLMRLRLRSSTRTHAMTAAHHPSRRRC